MIELSVCIGSSCHLKGSYNVIQVFQQLIEAYGAHDKIDFKATFCMKLCQQPGVSVSLDNITYNIPPNSAVDFFKTAVVPLLDS
jgi:NADH:ubiquinone oxidoreductase subunit E